VESSKAIGCSGSLKREFYDAPREAGTGLPVAISELADLVVARKVSHAYGQANIGSVEIIFKI
jgi:hypothetical protein